MSKILIAIAMLIVGIVVGGVFFTNPDPNFLIPRNGAEVEYCFDYADAISELSGGEAAYNSCSSNVDAYNEWRGMQ